MSSSVPQVSNKKTMWLHPKVLGFNPSERWGHSACFSKGLMYVFGVCMSLLKPLLLKKWKQVISSVLELKTIG